MSGKKVAIVPFPALGDATICLRLAQTLTAGGYSVTLFANLLVSSQPNFQWLTFKSLPTNIETLLIDFDLVLLDVLSPWVQHYLPAVLKRPNILLFTAKDFPGELMITKPRLSDELLASRLPIKALNRPFCLDKNVDKCMVDWVDEYAQTVFGLQAQSTLPSVTFNEGSADTEKIVIFPTTPNIRKNFSFRGFYKLATRLKKTNIAVEIVCMPNELASVRQHFQGFMVRAFPDISQLIDYLRTAKTVVSNDSGGGHLAAMLGIPTITITRKRKGFVWRPGYGLGNVVTPVIMFKLGRGHIWRPFISLNKIEKLIQRIELNG